MADLRRTIASIPLHADTTDAAKLAMVKATLDAAMRALKREKERKWEGRGVEWLEELLRGREVDASMISDADKAEAWALSIPEATLARHLNRYCSSTLTDPMSVRHFRAAIAVEMRRAATAANDERGNPCQPPPPKAPTTNS